MIRKSYPAETKVLDESQGLVEAVVNVTGLVDLQRDIMEPGCFSEVVKSAQAGELDYPSVCWNHDWGTTVGKVLEMAELTPGDGRLGDKLGRAGGGGLYIKAAYNLETQRGREAFSDIRFGAVRQWSVGFIPADGAVSYDGKGIRRITKVAELPEVSNVLVGASPGTFTAAAKGADEPEDRKERSADRYQKGKALLEGLKSDVSSQSQREGARYSLRDSDGNVKFPINDCGDVRDAWKLRGSSSIPKDRVERYVRRVAGKLKCDGPWNSDDDSGKALDDPELEAKEASADLEEKEGRIPDLQGAEAAHLQPLRTALVALERLISQEVAEDEPEFDCVMRLSSIGQQLLDWAQGEATEYNYADSPIPMATLMAAGYEVLTKGAAVEEPPVEPPSDEPMPSWLLAGIRDSIQQAFSEARDSHPQQHVPAPSSEPERLTNFARQRVRARFGG